MAITKRQKIIAEQVEVLKAYPLKDAISLIQNLPKLKFNESLDISVNLGVDSTKSDQNVRGSSSLPHGIGKTSRVAVFAEGHRSRCYPATSFIWMPRELISTP